MPGSASDSQCMERPMVATRRKQIWIEGSRIQGSGCSECAWMFKPSGPPIGGSLAEMKDIYERQRDKEFSAHVCAEHLDPRTQTSK